MKMYHIKLENEVVYRTSDKNKAFKQVAKMFHNGHEEISLYGGRIGKWWNE